MLNLLLQAQACGTLSGGVGIGFASLNQGGWIEINLAVVLISVLVAALIYVISRFLPTIREERLRGIAKYEIVEAFISIIIILILMGMTDFSCNAGAMLSSTTTNSQTYPGLYKFDSNYLGNLLFQQGTGIISQLYITSMEYVIASNIGVASWNWLANTFIPGSSNERISFELNPTNVADVYGAYSNQFTGIFAPMVLVSFSIMLVLFLLLPIIETISLTIVAPIAIIMRSLAFTGPKLREVSNTFLAIAIGLYFVFPLTLSFNYYVARCFNMINMGVPIPNCINPQYLNYTNPKPINIPVAALFNTNSVDLTNSGINLLGVSSAPLSLLPTLLSGGAASGFSVISLLWSAPTVALNYSNIVAEYVFIGIVLVALDFLITIGFMAGLSKGLNAISSLVSTGPFWE